MLKKTLIFDLEPMKVVFFLCVIFLKVPLIKILVHRGVGGVDRIVLFWNSYDGAVLGDSPPNPDKEQVIVSLLESTYMSFPF